MNDNYFDPSELIQAAESLDPTEVGQTTDFNDSGVITPGIYANPFREIRKQETKHDEQGRPYVQITFSLSGGIDLGEGRTAAAKYPLLAWVNTKPKQYEGQPGTTTSLAEYMAKAGHQVAGVPTRELLLMLPETLNQPVGVRVGLKAKGEKGADGKWYSDQTIKTKDFNTGDKKNPKWVYTIEKNGQTIKAANTVEGFARVPA